MTYEHKLLMGRDDTKDDDLLKWLTGQLYKHRIDGATITNGIGVWKGKLEPQTTLTVIGDVSEEIPLRKIAEKYAEDFNQESVLYTCAPLTEVSYITSVANRSAMSLQTFTK